MKHIQSLFFVSLAGLSIAVVASCGSYSAPTATSAGGSGNNTSSGGSANSAGTGAAGGAAVCDTGSMQCSGACTDPSSDNANCGACGHACVTGQTCQSGSCACATGHTLCSGGSACVDTSADPANCGSCGTACAAGQVCSLGVCSATCATTPTALTACSASCVDVSSNSENCGACGTACSAAQTCKGAMCTTPAICDLLAAAGHPCVSAHSTVRALSSSYTGPLYQVCNGTFVPGPDSCTSGMTKDIGTVAGGYADAASQDLFCAGGSCTISIIYDQSPNGNNLKPAPGGGPTGKVTPNNPAVANALPTKINTHSAYGILIKPGIGYRILVGNGIAKNDDPESMYMVSSQSDLKNLCCFDYGNAEIDAHDDGNGTMEAVNVSHGVVWGSGVNGGPWVMADLENGLYAGWVPGDPGDFSNVPTNTPVLFDFITGVVVGDVAAKNGGKGRFAIYGGDATSGPLTTMYDGIRPNKIGYVPMQKQGSIILGTGGDNSSFGGGRFYEGVMTNGTWTVATANAVQANIVAAGYGK